MNNQTSEEIFQEYQQELITLEDMFANRFGYYPLVSSNAFWQEKRVQAVECFVLLWWDIKEILSKGASQ